MLDKNLLGTLVRHEGGKEKRDKTVAEACLFGYTYYFFKDIFGCNSIGPMDSILFTIL